VNLAVNARDAMQGSGRLVFDIKQATPRMLQHAYGKFSDHAAYAGIEVSDSGCGIRPEHLERVFEPFFTTKSGGKGSGLGLAMVFGFVRQSQGVIDIASSWGHGATFSLYFPVAQQALAKEQRPLNDAPLPGGAETVLLVDDDGPVRQVLAAHLSWLGYTVVQAADGKQALDELIKPGRRIELLLTDVMMPGMSGYELTARALQLQPSLRFLYSTGYQGQQQGLASPDSRAPVLQKPYRREALARSVRQVLDQK
jgi:CheY-like chemotaxis protein